MGKGKARKPRTGAVEDLLHSVHEPHCMCHHNQPRAADGHNVNGWTDEDIRIYNELLTERAKLEREKNELEQKSARHQAERALLNEDAAAFDNLFKAQLGGEFKFIGKGTCCLDVHTDASSTGQQPTARNVACHHEICTRAKSQGVSWMELDTMKYYQARITSEKSQRMKNALRKQRDVELTRVKKDDEEEQALRLRKSAFQDRSFQAGGGGGGKDEAVSPSTGVSSSDLTVLEKNGGVVDPKENAILEAAKENEAVVKRIRSRLDKIRHDVSSGRVNAFDARAKLDQANRDMAEAERKNNTFKEMVFSAGSGQQELTTHSKPTNLSRALSESLISTGGDAFSQALNVVKGFFSASDPSDVQAAITDLRCVLEVNGPISPVLQKSFKALEDMLAKPNAKGFSVDLTDQDGTKRTCTNVVEVLLMLRNSEEYAKVDASAEVLKLDKATLQANTECIKVERQAMEEIRQIARGMTSGLTLAQHREYLERLRQVKDQAAMKSPIPPLSDIVLEDDLNRVFYTIQWSDLFHQIEDHDYGERDVAGRITSMIIAFSDRDPERYLTTLHHMSNTMRIFRPDLDHLDMVKRALETVKESMGKFVEKHREKVAAAAAAAAANSAGRARATEQDAAAAAAAAAAASTSLKPAGAADTNLVPGPLQPKKMAKSNQAATGSKQQNVGAIAGLDAVQLASQEMSGAMQVVHDMQQQLRGLTPDDLVNMLCTPEPGQSDLRATGILKGDLQKFLNLPTGLEDPKLLGRIQQQIAQLATNEAGRVGGASRARPSRESKFQEDLPVNMPASPPPYTANEGRARSSAKIKHVPVNTPRISAPSASSSKSTPTTTTTFTSAFDLADRQRIFSARTDFDGKSLEEKAQEMSSDLQKMRKDLLELSNLPGLSGNLAKKVRRHLDSLRRDMETIDVAGDGKGAPASSSTVPSTVAVEPTSVDAAAAAAGADSSGGGVNGTKQKAKKKSKKTPSQMPINTAAAAAAAATTATEAATSSPATPPAPRLSDRELTIQRQLYTLACSLNRLVETPAASLRLPPLTGSSSNTNTTTTNTTNNNNQYSLQDAFDGIVGRLEEQMAGHVEMARHVAEANGWKGLEEWLLRTFGNKQAQAQPRQQQQQQHQAGRR